jgi:hypothetical protein
MSAAHSKWLLPPLPNSVYEDDEIHLMQHYARAAQALAVEICAKEAEHWQTISTTPGHACGQYIAGAIRASWRIRVEPT